MLIQNQCLGVAFGLLGGRFPPSRFMKCESCNKEIEIEQSYRCRICHHYYCSDCSLEHFGLEERNGRVIHKSIIKSFFWNLHKKFWRKD